MLLRERGVIKRKERRLEALGVVCEEEIKSYYQVYELFYDNKYDVNSYVIEISFAIFKPKYHILILFGKGYIRSYKIKTFEQ